MKSGPWRKRAVLFLLIVYSLDLVWKLASWNEAFNGVPWWNCDTLGLAVDLPLWGCPVIVPATQKKLPELCL